MKWNIDLTNANDHETVGLWHPHHSLRSHQKQLRHAIFRFLFLSDILLQLTCTNITNSRYHEYLLVCLKRKPYFIDYVVCSVARYCLFGASVQIKYIE